MKSGVKNGNLRNIRQFALDSSDYQSGGIIVQRRQNGQFFNLADNFVINQRRGFEDGAALDNAVSDGVDVAEAVDDAV